MGEMTNCGCDYGEARQCKLHAGTPSHGYELNDYREIACEFCGGDGGGEVVIGHDPSGPVTSFERCLTCHGTGLAYVECKPITVEDLSDEA